MIQVRKQDLSLKLELSQSSSTNPFKETTDISEEKLIIESPPALPTYYSFKNDHFKDFVESESTSNRKNLKENSDKSSSIKDEESHNKKLSLVEIEEIKTTLANIDFDIPASSSTSRTPSTVILTQDESVPVWKNQTIISDTSEAEPQNLDDVIASLQKVAARENPFQMDKVALKNLLREELKEYLREKSIFKHSKRDDDDLESLASVDTDMAPLSETSRDLENTYSDLESVTESVSSRGDYLQNVSKDQTLSEGSNSNTFQIRDNTKDTISSFPIFPKTKVVFEDSKQNYYKKIKSDYIKQKRRDLAFLPVEELQSLIAELDEVMSSCSSSSNEDQLEKAEATEENKTKSEAVPVSSIFYTSFDERSIDPLTKEIDNSKRSSNPIEFNIQEVHVPGDVEFAKAFVTVQYHDPETDSIHRRLRPPIVKDLEMVSTQPSSIANIFVPASDDVSRKSPNTAVLTNLTSTALASVFSNTNNVNKRSKDSSLSYALKTAPITGYSATVTTTTDPNIPFANKKSAQNNYSWKVSRSRY